MVYIFFQEILIYMKFYLGEKLNMSRLNKTFFCVNIKIGKNKKINHLSKIRINVTDIIDV